jgi:hypothetical protein
VNLWSTCVEVQEGLAATRCGPWRCRGAEEALGVLQLLCSDTLRVRLCQLGLASPRWTFWSLLGSEGGRLQGLTCGPRSPRGSFVLWCHTPCVTLSEKWPVMLYRRGSTGEPLSLGSLGRVFLCPGLGWRRQPGRSQGPGWSVVVDQEPGASVLRQTPESQAEVAL